MDRALWEQHLFLAERHVAAGERHVARQREIVAELERQGHDSGVAVRLLDSFEKLLAVHRKDRDRLRADLGRRPPREDAPPPDLA